MRAYIPGEQIYSAKVIFLRLAFELVLIFFLELHFLEYHEKSSKTLGQVLPLFISKNEVMKCAALYSKIKE